MYGMYGNDGTWIHKLATRKYTCKTFHAYLEMREPYYAGGVLFISGKRSDFYLSDIFTNFVVSKYSRNVEILSNRIVIGINLFE